VPARRALRPRVRPPELLPKLRAAAKSAGREAPQDCAPTGGKMRSRDAVALAEETVARQMAAGCAVPTSLVASIAHGFGVPTETLCTVLLLCAVLFVWRCGTTILHTLGVLLVSAALTLYAFIRRVRRQWSTLTLLSLAAVAVACATYMMPDSAQGGALSLLSSRLLRPPMNAFAASMSR